MKVGVTKGNWTSGSDSQSITYDGALGDAVAFVLITVGHTAPGSTTRDQGAMLWFSDGTNEHSAFSYLGGGTTRTGAQRGRNTGGYLEDEAGNVLMDGTSSIDTANNQIDFTFDTGEGPSSAFEYCLISFHGSDVNALCVSHDGTDQTESIGFDWSFVLSTGASTTSTTSTNAALNWGMCDKSGNQACIRIGQADGGTITFSVLRDDSIATNIFNNSPYEKLSIPPANITTNGFDLDCTTESNGDEPGVYLAIGCDNDVEVVVNDELTAATGTESTTVTIETEYALLGYAVNSTTVNTIEYSLGGGDVSWGLGVADLSGGVGASGDYFGYGVGGQGATAGDSILSHAYCIAGLDGANTVEAEVNSVSSSALEFQKDTAGATTRMFFLNIGAEPAASNPVSTVASATSSGVSASSVAVSYTASATSTALDATLSTDSAPPASGTASALDASAQTVTSGTAASATATATLASAANSITTQASSVASALSGSAKVVSYAASASAVAIDGASGIPVGGTASAVASASNATLKTGAAAPASASATATNAAGSTPLTSGAASASAAASDGAVQGAFPTSTDWNETDYENALTFADLFDNEAFSGFAATYSIPEDYNAHSHYGATEAASWSDYTYSGKLYRASSTIGIGVTVYSDYPNSDTYYRLRVNGTTSSWDLNGHPDSGGSPITDTYSGPNPTLNEVFFKVKVTNESGQVRVQAKVWDGGEENEPGAWNLEAVDTDAGRPTSGTIGLWTGHNPSVSNTSKAYWYDLKVDLGDGNGPQSVPLQSNPTVTEVARASAVARTGVVDPTTEVASATATAYEGVLDVTLVASASASANDGEVGNLQSSVTRNGITWTFDSSYKVGQYITGDWWVLAPSGMTVNSVSPTPTSTRNGSVKNPLTQTATGFDSRVSNNDMGNIAESFPLAMAAGDSLVSTISSPETVDSEEDVIGKFTTKAYLSGAEVLTVVATEPSATAFRPQYSGNGTKTTYDFADVDTSLLPELADAGGAIKYNAQGGTDMEAIERQFSRPWIFVGSDFVGRQVHPKQNMPDYHEYVYEVISDASLKLLTDGWTQEALVGFIQAGIDNYYCALTGTPDSSGNKWLSIFAGIMLDVAAMRGDLRSYRTGLMAYYISDGTSSITSSVVTAGETWTGSTVGWRQDPGDTEHEHLDPATEWNLVANTGSGGKREHYRRENSKTWPGFALAARLMDGITDWDHAAFFDYVDRWMTEPDAENYAYLLSLYEDETLDGNPTSTVAEQSSSTFVNNMWDAYRESNPTTTVASATATASNAFATPTSTTASATAAALDAEPSTDPNPETTLASATASASNGTNKTGSAAPAVATASGISASSNVLTASPASASASATYATSKVSSYRAQATSEGLDAQARLRLSVEVDESLSISESYILNPLKLGDNLSVTEAYTVEKYSATIIAVHLIGYPVTISLQGETDEKQ